MIAYHLPNKRQEELEKDIALDQIVGYGVGEYILIKTEMTGSERTVAAKTDKKGVCYEIVTAWVDERFRGLNISTELYLQIIGRVSFLRPCQYLLFDLLKGSVERVIQSSYFLQILYQYVFVLLLLLLLHRLTHHLNRLNVLNLILRRREDSYEVMNTRTHQTESFEQVLLDLRLLSWGVWVRNWVRSKWEWFSKGV